MSGGDNILKSRIENSSQCSESVTDKGSQWLDSGPIIKAGKALSQSRQEFE